MTRLLKSIEVAHQLGISQTTVRRLVERGALLYVPINGRGSRSKVGGYRFTQKAVDRFIAETETKMDRRRVRGGKLIHIGDPN